MVAPALSEPNKCTFPTYQVPLESAMRGRAPPVEGLTAALSVIAGRCADPSLVRMQSVTENYCLLNSVTVPKIQRNAAHNNSDKLACKSGALIQGQDIPNQKSDTQYLHNNDYYTLDRLIALTARQRALERQGVLMRPLRLCGGGESSISTGTSGWGSPPSQQAANNNTTGWGTANPANPNSTGTQQWNNNANRPAPAQGQDANKQNSNMGQPPATSQPSNPGWGPKPPASNNGNNAQQTTNASQQPQPQPTSTKQQLEQLNNMREAIFSSDGWGGQHVNQDTSWDIPGSPEPAMKMDGAPPWKPNVNNGTELWEANLRNGGQPPPQPQQKVPWGHTPSTNIGGTWGEDDDVTDNSNVWTGVPPAQQQWGGPNAGNNAGIWGGAGTASIFFCNRMDYI